MTLQPLPEAYDIWAPLPSRGVPNTLKSRVYAARANALLARALLHGTHHPLLVSGAVNRSMLAFEIGCGSATITQNSVIRELMEFVDTQLKDRTPSPAARLVREAILTLPRMDEENQAPLAFTSTVSRIVQTTSECILYGKSYPGIPAIYFAEGIHTLSSNWLRHICVHLGLEVSTALQYASLLRPFLLHLRKRGIALSEVSDLHLIEWRNKIEQNSKRKRAYANSSILTIFRFLVHCELRGDLIYRVGCYERSALPEALRAAQFPVTATLVFEKGGSLKWTTPLAFRTVPDSAGNRGTPTDEEMKVLHRLARRLRYSSRFTTILTIVEFTGARLFELLQLKISDLPEKSVLYAMLDTDDAKVEIEVTRKGGKPKPLYFDAHTLLVARAYLAQRAELVKWIRQRNPNYIPPDEIFISAKTGEVLKPDSISKLFRRLARWVGLRKIGIHRVRAKFAIDTIDRILSKYLAIGIQFDSSSGWIETILQQAAAEMGHENVHSLRYYLHAALDRRMRSLARAASTSQDASHVDAERARAEEKMVKEMLNHMDEATVRETGQLLERAP